MKRQTAGELSLKAATDKTKYDPLEVGHALTDDVVEQLRICAERHEKIFDEIEYCLILVIAGDPLIKGVRRHKYTAFPYLPKPRPQQSVYLYNKITKSMKRLWSMPDAKVMATISEMPTVAEKWKNTRAWSKAFFHGWQYISENDTWINKTPTYFFDFIRHQHDIKMPSEKEYLDANREKLIQAGCQELLSRPSDPFDFSKIAINKIVDTADPIINQDSLNNLGKT